MNKHTASYRGAGEKLTLHHRDSWVQEQSPQPRTFNRGRIHIPGVRCTLSILPCSIINELAQSYSNLVWRYYYMPLTWSLVCAVATHREIMYRCSLPFMFVKLKLYLYIHNKHLAQLPGCQVAVIKQDVHSSGP